MSIETAIALAALAALWYWFVLALCGAARRADDASERWFHHHGRV